MKITISQISQKLLQTYPYRYLTALIAGVVLPFAFSPYHIVVLALVSPTLLFYLWLDADRKQAVKLAYAFGVGFFGVGVSWVAVSMIRYGGVAFPLATALTLLFAAILSSYLAVIGYLYARFFSSLSLASRSLLVLPALWTLGEWVRGWLFTGFPWLNLGYTQTDGPLAGFAPILGVYGLSYLLALGAGVQLWAFLSSRRERVIALSVSLSVCIVAIFLNHYDWATPYKNKIKVSLLQGNVPQDKKWLPEYRQSSIDMYTRMTRENLGNDLIIWPETALPAYYHQSRFYLEQLQQEAAKRNSHVLLGLVVIDETDRSRYYNAMVLVGEPNQFYFKSHLVPFGEFLPFKSILGEAIRFLKIPMAILISH